MFNINKELTQKISPYTGMNSYLDTISTSCSLSSNIIDNKSNYTQMQNSLGIYLTRFVILSLSLENLKASFSLFHLTTINHKVT